MAADDSRGKARQGEPRVRVLFVCTGNICRSPTAEGVFRALVERGGLAHAIAVDSAGTHAYHVGEPPDERSQAVCLRRGIDIAGQRARQVSPADFERFDLILAMDRGHRSILLRRCPPDKAERVRLFLDYAPELGRSDVPDPYFGGELGFETVLDLIEEGARGLLQYLRTNLALK